MERLQCARYVFNQTIDYIRSCINFSPSWMDIKKDLLKQLPKWCDDTPFQIKAIAVKEAHQAYWKAKGHPKFRSRKNPTQSYYSEFAAGQIGYDDFGRIQRLCFYLDDLISRTSKAKSRAKRRMKIAQARMRKKIQNLVKEIHFKTARFLVDNFDVILLPTFEYNKPVGWEKESQATL
ncbi:MAG: hypothetical protein ABFS56_32670 [Pseudomonadota bacterium]